MGVRVVTREEVIHNFEPAHELLQTTVEEARKQTTLQRFAKLHPEVTREAALSRLAGQTRWMVIAENLAATIASIEGFSVLSTDAQHNSGQYLFGCPGGILTVRREPHDESDPDDGKYIQEALTEILEQADLAPGIDPGAPIVAYLSVTLNTAVLKVCHSTLSDTMKIALSDLQPAPQHVSAAPKSPRARARSTRKSANTDVTAIAQTPDSSS